MQTVHWDCNTLLYSLCFLWLTLAMPVSPSCVPEMCCLSILTCRSFGSSKSGRLCQNPDGQKKLKPQNSLFTPGTLILFWTFSWNSASWHSFTLGTLILFWTFSWNSASWHSCFLRHVVPYVHLFTWHFQIPVLRRHSSGTRDTLQKWLVQAFHKIFSLVLPFSHESEHKSHDLTFCTSFSQVSIKAEFNAVHTYRMCKHFDMST